MFGTSVYGEMHRLFNSLHYSNHKEKENSREFFFLFYKCGQKWLRWGVRIKQQSGLWFAQSPARPSYIRWYLGVSWVSGVHVYKQSTIRKTTTACRGWVFERDTCASCPVSDNKSREGVCFDHWSTQIDIYSAYQGTSLSARLSWHLTVGNCRSMVISMVYW